uniref:MARVEL domain-containing protein n=1 Tax=Syphacia muris TaxID=451379 RepID=A0A0N5AHJ1_9BILA
MAVSIRRFKEVPNIFKPIAVIILFFLFIFYACKCVSWWCWLSWVIETIVVVGLSAGIALDYDTQMFHLWYFAELVISGVFVCIGILNIILHIVWLVKHHNALIGIEAICVVLFSAVFALNGVVSRKLLKATNSSSSTTYPPPTNVNVGGINPAATNQYPPGATNPASEQRIANTTSYPQNYPPTTNYRTQP